MNPDTPASVDPERLERYREMWEDELVGAALYRALAEHADDSRRDVFLRLADAEERHAEHWAGLLADHGVTGLRPPRLPFRVRLLGFIARRFGSDAVIPMVLRLEAADAAKYRTVPEAPESMAASEEAHGRVLSALGSDSTGETIARAEGRHRTGVGGALRASVFGVNDGLVSNLALVMGVAGGSDTSDVVLLAGVAGLVAGAFSMAAGEWISVRSQRELYEREIAIEAMELEAFPEEEREELSLIYQAKGIPEAEAEALASRIMARPDTALDTLAREELGLDPGALGSAWVAAISSFLAFALGASVPVLPFVVSEGGAALGVAAVISGISLFGIGVLTTLFTARPAVRAGLRMVMVGAMAAAITYGIGSAVGVALD